MLPFDLHSDPVAVFQRDVLHDPSVYVINRKSVLVNKPCVYYNNNSCNTHCGPLSMNALKWSEGLLGDNLSIEGNCKYEEPIWSIVMDADYQNFIYLSKVEGFIMGLHIQHSQRVVVLSLRIFL